MKAVPPARSLVSVMVCHSPVNRNVNLCSLELHRISSNLLFNLHVIQKKRIKEKESS